MHVVAEAEALVIAFMRLVPRQQIVVQELTANQVNPITLLLYCSRAER